MGPEYPPPSPPLLPPVISGGDEETEYRAKGETDCVYMQGRKRET